ncbi:MAG: hypothetical protein R3C25_07205 [Hyphomonadaceae bacterium]
MSRDATTALRAINRILWRDWNPIGFSVPEDEYQSYAPGVLRLLRAGADHYNLVVHLRRVAEESMASPISEERAALVADRLLALGLTN